jgi:hypothetical protein
MPLLNVARADLDAASAGEDQVVGDVEVAGVVPGCDAIALAAAEDYVVLYRRAIGRQIDAMAQVGARVVAPDIADDVVADQAAAIARITVDLDPGGALPIARPWGCRRDGAAGHVLDRYRLLELLTTLLFSIVQLVASQ